MYCPVDGDEFVEGITRCPEHDVALVDEPPELEQRRSQLDTEWVQRVAWWLLLGAAVFLAGSALLSNAIEINTIRTREPVGFDAIPYLFRIGLVARALGTAALGVMVGTFLFRAHAQTSWREDPQGPRWAMRILFGLLVGFVLSWAVTEIGISNEETRFEYARYHNSFEDLAGIFPPAEPSESYVYLASINRVMRTLAQGTFGLMVGLWMMSSSGQSLLRSRGNSDSDDIRGQEESS